ncbi:MAG: hypothetical protein IJI25_12615 [Eubacterium sp.]|nr:hypothetical protein [Eubacterium sp.]
MKNNLKRISALVVVLLLIGLVLLTLYLSVTGSPYFMASMVSMFLLPILIYSYMFIYRLMHKEDPSGGSRDAQKGNNRNVSSKNT